MRLLRDRLFKFEPEVDWFEQEYKENIENKRMEDTKKGRPPKNDFEYFANGKNLFSVLSNKYESYGNNRKDFRERICNIIVEYLDASSFEEELSESLKIIFNQ